MDISVQYLQIIVSILQKLASTSLIMFQGYIAYFIYRQNYIDVESEIPITAIVTDEVPSIKPESDYSMDTIEVYSYDVEQHTINISNELNDGNVDSESTDEQPTDDKHSIELFNCNTCNINFTSITDHLNVFHQNESVNIELDTDNKPMKQEINDDYKLIKNKEGTTLVDAWAPIYRCPICIFSYTNAKALAGHMRVHKINSKTNQEKVQKVLKIAEDDTNVIHQCTICKTILQSKKSLKLHGKMHRNLQNNCDNSTEYNRDDNLSNNDPDTDGQNTFYCNICNESFQKHLKKDHNQMHHGDNLLTCKKCNKSFTTEYNLKTHLTIIHQEQSNYQESFVKKLVCEKTSNNVEKEQEKKPTKATYDCHYCGKQFGRPHEKVKHERIHTGEKPYACKICGKTFRVAYCLTTHMKTHNTARPYVCHHCGKGFKSLSVYSHHLLIHSDLRGYKCPQCPKTFKTAVQLAGHKNSHNKPYSCDKCNRPFSSIFALRGHLETHRKVQLNLKHMCAICGARYARLFALKDHIRVHHEIDPDGINDKIQMKVDGIDYSKGRGEMDTVNKIIQDVGKTNQIESSKHDFEVTMVEIDEFDNVEVVTDWLK